MKLVVGLGNPGRQYAETRHNVGFGVIEELARRTSAGRPKVTFEAEVAETQLGGQKALLVCPQTFMNLSGSSVLRLRDFYKLAHEDILVVCDDFNLPLARLRLRNSGSAGGQKGLGDIIHRLATEAIPRLRIGVGSPPSGFRAADFVLSKFRKEELPEIQIALLEAADAVVEWASRGMAAAMNKYNKAGSE